MRKHLKIGKETGGLYFVDHKSCFSNVASSSSSSQSNNTSSSQSRTHSVFSFSCQFSSLELWHCRLGHMPFDSMKYIDVVSSCNSKSRSICQVCHQARQHRSPFPISSSCTSQLFELIHVDL